MSFKDRLPILADDGLNTPEVGEWAYKKYLRVWMHDELFTTSMRDRWMLVYVDLFAGAGRARLRDSKRIVPSSALLSLDLPHRFHRYIFCEADQQRMEALRARVTIVAPDAEVYFVPGDVNAQVDEVRALVPHDALSFCFADPYSVNIRADTIRRISEGRRMDFLILLAVQMDANRNRALYTAEDSKKLDAFLGNHDWRKEWREREGRGGDFREFLLEQYVQKMQRIGYVETRRSEMYEMKTERNLSIYYLAFFGKHELGKKFWKQVLKYNEPQTSLFDAFDL